MSSEILSELDNIELWFRGSCDFQNQLDSQIAYAWEEIAKLIRYHLGDDSITLDRRRRDPQRAICVLWPLLVSTINAISSEIREQPPWG